MSLRILLLTASALLSACSGGDRWGDCCEECTLTATVCEESTKDDCDYVIEVHEQNEDCWAWFEPY